MGCRIRAEPQVTGPLRDSPALHRCGGLSRIEGDSLVLSEDNELGECPK